MLKQVLAGMKVLFYDHPGSGDTPRAGDGIQGEYLTTDHLLRSSGDPL